MGTLEATRYAHLINFVVNWELNVAFYTLFSTDPKIR